MMASTLIRGNPMLSYAELQVILAKAANIMNNRPIGVKSLSEDSCNVVTPNQILIGRTSTSDLGSNEVVEENLSKSSKYQEELLNMWWKMWFHQVFPNLVPYAKHKDTNAMKI